MVFFFSGCLRQVLLYGPFSAEIMDLMCCSFKFVCFILYMTIYVTSKAKCFSVKLYLFAYPSA